jgi:hypothetical protein
MSLILRQLLKLWKSFLVVVLIFDFEEYSERVVIKSLLLSTNLKILAVQSKVETGFVLDPPINDSRSIQGPKRPFSWSNIFLSVIYFDIFAFQVPGK